jgi:F-type H+-transporting ATPase subunit b
MEIISATALISINETFFIQLISFLVFLFVLNRVMIRPLVSTMEQRKEYLADVKTDIDKAKSNLDDFNAELDHQRLQVRKEADAAVLEIEEEADVRAAELVGAARSQITALRQETEKKVNQQLKDARAQLTGEVAAVTTKIMETLLDRRL